MTTAYEIYEINSYRDERCAVASSYKKAIEYVFANINRKAEGVKINGEWVHCDLAKYFKKPQEDICIFGKYNGYGYYSQGFRIVAIEII